MTNLQAVESIFASIKRMSKNEFGERAPTLSDLVCILPMILDARNEARVTLTTVHGKRLVIFHPNPLYREALEKASWELNAAVIRIYHEAFEKFDSKVFFYNCFLRQI